MYLREIAGKGIRQLAEAFGTPLYVYDGKKIIERLTELGEFGRVRFAMKALPNLAVLSLVRKQGALVDCVSEGELMRALKAGYLPSEIVYTCDIFSRSSLDFVQKHNIPVNAGSIDMIHQYGPQAQRREITLRINPGFGHGHSQKTNTGGPNSKHGIWHEHLGEALQAAKQYGLCVSGIHMHIGSGVDFEHLAQVCNAMRSVCLQVGPSVSMISAGGGLPIAYCPGDVEIDFKRYSALWQAVKADLETEFAHEVSLEIEPGRFIVAESGFLLAEIRAVKRMGENLFYLVDAGFNNLARPAMYGSYHQISICLADDARCDSSVRNASVRNASVNAAVGGPLCESGDIFTQKEGGYVHFRELPVAQVGDYLLLHNAGAYGSAMGSNYNSHPHCAEVLILNGGVHLVRRRQRLESLLEDEMIPGSG